MEKRNETQDTTRSSTELPVTIPDDAPECFICRELEVTDRDSLLHYCDCKSLVAHHKCLLTWIQKGPKNEDRLSCKVCTAEYHLQTGSAWKLVAFRWQNWVILAVILGLMTIVPFTVYRMMTAFDDPPPHSLFKAASVCFGLLSETFLIKTLIYCCNSKYRKAKMSSFSIRERNSEKCDRGRNLLWLPSHSPTATAGSRIEGGKQETARLSKGLELCV